MTSEGENGENPPPLSVVPPLSITPESTVLASSVSSTPLATNRKSFAKTSTLPECSLVETGKATAKINTTSAKTTVKAVFGRKSTPLPLPECPLLCCFYAEFDNKVGPRVCFQSPKRFMESDIREKMDAFEKRLEEEFQRLIVNDNSAPENEDDYNANNQDATSTSLAEDKSNDGTESNASDSIFDSCSEYIITGNELVANIINLSTHNLHVISRPTMIADEKYERNSLLFSIGFVLKRSVDPRPFRPVLSKIAVTLRDMEVESQFLTCQRKQIQILLENLLVSLNSEKAECNLILGPADVLNLKLFRPPRMPTPPVKDHQVPILLRRDWQVQTYDWDLSINWVSCHIDGIVNARQISRIAEVDLEMVRACLRVLKHHGVIALLDMFFYTNRYECTSKIATLFQTKEGNEHYDTKLLVDAMEYATKRPTASSSTSRMPVLPYGSDVSPETLSSSPVTGQSRMLEIFPNLSASLNAESLREGHLLSGLGRSSASHGSPHENSVFHVLKKDDLFLVKKAIPEFLCALNRSVTIGDLWLALVSGRHPAGTSSSVDWERAFHMIDHRRLITFAIVNGLIQRIHNYPLLLDDQVGPSIQLEIDQITPSASSLLDRGLSTKSSIQHNLHLRQQLEERRKITARAASMMDGTHCDDELVCACDMPLSGILDLFRGRRIVSIFAPANTTHTNEKD